MLVFLITVLYNLNLRSHMYSPSSLSLYAALVFFTALEFSTFFSNSEVSLSPDMNSDQLVLIFNSACSTALNTVAPLKPRKRQARSSPQLWLNASTHALRQECRWKKDGLQVYQILKVSNHLSKVCQRCKISILFKFDCHECKQAKSSSHLIQPLAQPLLAISRPAQNSWV